MFRVLTPIIRSTYNCNYSFWYWLTRYTTIRSRYWVGTDSWVSYGRYSAVAQWLRCCATIRKVAGSIPASVSGFFIDIKSFRSHYCPGVDSASNRNEYQEYFLGCKSGRCVRLTTLPPSCSVVTKSGNLNFLEPSEPLRACNGTALPYVHQHMHTIKL